MKKTLSAPTIHTLNKRITDANKRGWKQAGRVFFDELVRGGVYVTLIELEDLKCPTSHYRQQKL